MTIGDGKFYSNGLDLEWMAGPGREQAAACIDRVHALLARMLTFPAITIAALNGHTFAAGAMFALAHDYRVMRSDRGYFCLPEIDIRIPFTKGMSALIKARLSKVTAHEAMVTGRRYGADDAVRASIVHETAVESAVLGATRSRSASATRARIPRRSRRSSKSPTNTCSKRWAAQARFSRSPADAHSSG